MGKKKNFLEFALEELEEYCLYVTTDCLDKHFSVELNFGVLFTRYDKYEEDLIYIDRFFSSSVIKYLKNNKDEKGLVEVDTKLDNGSYNKMVIFKAFSEDNEYLGLIAIEANLNGDIEDKDSLNCMFVDALFEMMKEIDFTQLADVNHLVFNFNFNQ